eukprot:CAMPEP_0118942196 /NCGR_PEP_ID=MMETSP1169-20130426/35666_1 /TAXON_ID=36882 /ORGANISM="Pyramimonas obovata, Strain CCMP722" /LENGTH=396 /DNA_ID=CAMNT_0006887175 /DNA_START=36 /DNA_END=1223 /DNA_ORIENTATION=-
MAGKEKSASKPSSEGKPRKKEKRSDARAQQGALVRQLAMGTAAFVVLLAVLANIFYSPAKVVSLSLNDSQKLKEVLLAPDPWLVQCTRDDTMSEKFDVLAEETAKALRIKDSDVQVGSINCSQPLPGSGKSIYQKFLKKRERPDFIVAANGERPKAVPAKYVTQARALSEYVHKVTSPKLRAISSSSTLSSSCFDTISRPCFLLVTATRDNLETKYPWLRSVVKRHRATPFGLLNTSKYAASFQKSLPSEEEAGGHPRVVVLQKAKSGDAGADTTEYMARAMRDVEFNEASIDALIASVQSGGTELRALSKKPSVKSLKPAPKPKSKPSNQRAPPVKPKASQAPPPAAGRQGAEDAGWEQRRREEMERLEAENALLWEADEEAVDGEYVADYEEEE